MSEKTDGSEEEQENAAGFFEDDWKNGIDHNFIYEEDQPESVDGGNRGWMICKNCGGRKFVRIRFDHLGKGHGHIRNREPKDLNLKCPKPAN